MEHWILWRIPWSIARLLQLPIFESFCLNANHVMKQTPFSDRRSKFPSSRKPTETFKLRKEHAGPNCKGPSLVRHNLTNLFLHLFPYWIMMLTFAWTHGQTISVDIVMQFSGDSKCFIMHTICGLYVRFINCDFPGEGVGFRIFRDS